MGQRLIAELTIDAFVRLGGQMMPQAARSTDIRTIGRPNEGLTARVGDPFATERESGVGTGRIRRIRTPDRRMVPNGLGGGV